MSAFRPLPAKPNLEHERKAAKALLRQLRSGNSDALQRVQAHIRDVTAESTAQLKLGDAQRVIAREYGFSSWIRLVQYFGDVERQRYEHLNGTGWRRMIGPAARLSSSVQELLQGHAIRSEFAGRALAAYVPRFYGSTLDEVYSHEVTEAEAQLAVARVEGFGSWVALLQTAAQCEVIRRDDPWHVDEWSDASAAILANDMPALEAIVAAHPQLIEARADASSGAQRLLTTALAYAEDDDDVRIDRIVQWLVSRGASLSPLLGGRGGLGSRTNHVRQLLELGADPNWLMPNGRPVLEHALIAWQNSEAVDLLAARATRRDAWWIAAGLGDVAGVARGLDAKGKPRATARRDRPDFSAIAHRMMPQIPDPSDEDLLQEVCWVALSNDRGNVVEYLVRRGFDANGEMFGARYVAVAVEEVRQKVVAALVRCGADVTQRGTRHHSARDAARENFLQWPTARYRHIAQLVGLDPDALLAERQAVPVKEPALGYRVDEAMQLASDDAHRSGASEVSAEHLFIGLLRARNAIHQLVRHRGHMNVRAFLDAYRERLLPHDDRLPQPMLSLSADVQQVLRVATRHAREAYRESVSADDILGVLVRADDEPIAQLLLSFGANLATLRRALNR